MRVFKYKVLDEHRIVIMNYIRKETEQEAYEELKQDYPNYTMKLVEVCPPSEWAC